MTLTFDSAENTKGSVERRHSSRVRVAQMIYIKVGEGNGGFILNLGEGGLAVQAAMALIDNQFPSMRFHFSNSKTWIETSGVVAWKSESKKMAGIKFIDLPEESRAQINEWISSQGIGAQAPIGLEIGRPPEAPENTSAQEPVERDFAAADHKQNSAHLPESVTVLHGGASASASAIANAPEEAGPQNGKRSMNVVPNQELPEPRPPEGTQTRRAKISRTLLKRYLVDERHRIRLYDLVSEKAEKLSYELTEGNFPSDVPVTEKEFIRRLRRYEELTEELISVFITGCFWGEKNQELIWVKLLERIANAPATRSGRPQWLALQAYPALLLLYAGGLAAIANEKFTTLESLLVKPKLIGPDGDCRLVDRLSAAAVIEDERLVRAIGSGAGHAALSAYLCGFLREQFREFVPSDDVYDEIFDHFEYLFSLVWIDENPVGASLGWVPLGRFAWRHLTGLQSNASVMGRISAEASQQGKDWPVFRAGLFGGSMQRFVSARNRVATFMASQR